MFRSLCLIFALAAVPLAAETRVPTSQAEISFGFAPLVKQAAPAVVNIYAKRVVQVQSSPFMNDPFFQDFFQGFSGPPRPQVQNSLGSGVILAGDGLMVTNYHVVREATDIRVVLNDRREYDARVLLADQESDLAILQLDGASDMPHLPFRDSESIEVGELVLAIGNPFGVGQTVTSGIISGLARSGTASGGARGYFIQTDAPINPGNSGGALVDVNGALVGINTRILTRSGGSNGIGFAIPSSLVQRFVEQARDGHDKFQRPWAGMNGQPVDSDIAESLGLATPQGLVISDLHEVSPFLAAGFQPGDVIVAVGGQAVNTPDEMIFRMTVAGLGNTVAVTRIRAGEAEAVAVALMAAPDVPSRDAQTTGKRSALPGMVLWSLNPAVLAELGLPLSVDGVVVADPGPAGARAGLARGDVLRSINGEEVHDSTAAVAALRKASRRLTLDVQRGARRVVMRFRL
ncbi:trypsin-like peptidase domain-containing protein [Alisedimentitalea sp. MJ-SS2]|uniref:trypsin-like peptidase domain-containing protein n=1 Tax=Aliisedimentitalea sp. MJ-SS2 TaxID=3049795 RepID=UPI0029096BDE|nr:trypsin-like peptidase domain-containing protein [Alisedimentitalea sp. MJ-SS2]MDU8928602.1 trypsin-like peptidase domain-containing protein [Alisedimentitalea sp. MJ-SS2]